jgi:hypothetical protein
MSDEATKKTEYEVEVSHYEVLLDDAQALADRAASGSPTPQHTNLFARHSMLSTVLASEALINRVLAKFCPPSIYKGIDRLSLTDKWLAGPILCWHGETFDTGSEPFQSFAELVRIRNGLVHPKAGVFVAAEYAGQVALKTSLDRKEVPRLFPAITVIENPLWPQTRIPKNPRKIMASHARLAIGVLEKMEQKLIDLSKGAITHDSIRQLGWRKKDGESMGALPYFCIFHWD